jgi:hypothetical protein
MSIGARLPGCDEHAARQHAAEARRFREKGME